MPCPRNASLAEAARYLDDFADPSNRFEAAFGRSPLESRPPRISEPRLAPAALPPHGMVFSPEVSEFELRQRRVLDFLSGKANPRSQRIQRRVQEEHGPDHRSIMHEVHANGLAREIASELRRKLLTLSPPDTSDLQWPNHTVPLDALARLPPEDQEWLLPATFLPTWLDVDAVVENRLNDVFIRAQRPDGTVDAEAVRRSFDPRAVDLLERAKQSWLKRTPAERHWMANGVDSEPYDPVDRAITQAELEVLEREHPDYFAYLMQSAPIPRTQPVLHAVAESNGLSLKGCELFMVQHCLGSIYGLVDECVRRGAQASMVPVVYSKSAIVARCVRDRVDFIEAAQNTAVAPRDIEPKMEVDVFRGLQQSLRRAKEQGKTYVAIDDGGWMIRILSGRAKFLESEGLGEEYRALLSEFYNFPMRIIEQTENGVREAERVIEAQGRLPPGVTLIPLGRAPAKLVDSRWVGYRGSYRLEREVIDLGLGNLEGKRILQMGYGHTGAQLAKYNRRAKAEVVVFDTNEEALQQAKRDGFEVCTKLEKSLPDADIVLGSTGSVPLGKEGLRLLKSRAVLASTSSKALEFYNAHLAATDSQFLHPNHKLGHGEATVVAPGKSMIPNRTHRVVLKDPEDPFFEKEYFALNGLCPLGFDRQVNDFPPELVQIVEAAKAQALSEILELPTGLGMVPLSDEGNQRVLDFADTLRPGWRDELAI